MKYKLVKVISGDLHISNDIVLTTENPFIVIDESQVKDVISFNTYRKENPFCRVLEIKEEVIGKKLNK